MNKNKELHRGQVLHKIAKLSSLKIGEISQRAGYKYSTFFAHIKKEDLAYEILARYGKVLQHDFSNEFPQMSEYVFYEDNKYNKELTYPELLEDRDQWKDKFYDISDKYNKLSDKYNKLLEKELGMNNEGS